MEETSDGTDALMSKVISEASDYLFSSDIMLNESADKILSDPETALIEKQCNDGNKQCSSYSALNVDEQDSVSICSIALIH